MSNSPNLTSSRVSPSESRTTVREPIAIVGMSCRFPGANSPAAFWDLLRNGVDAITEVPKSRWNNRDFYDPNPMAAGKVNTRWGGFLNQVDQFDPYFFGISPREAICMDPQQRLLLELAWEAMEDGGQVAEHLAGTPVGVFIGLSNNDYARMYMNPALIDPYMGTGNAGSIAANRISYVFDFRGPSFIVDTACSSALVAVHLACTSLWSGESTLALAGGASVILSPAVTIAFTKAGMMSPDGRCKSFDAGANGYVRSEGAGVVVLKPLSLALADGDPVQAVIRGTAVNQDGRSNGMTAPNREAQEAVILEACRMAGISPADLSYMEAHGTGTSLGDPIEAKAIGSAVSIGRKNGSRCAIGSVKSNVGHMEAAAGICGLIKVALALTHREIPPSLHFHRPNPLIPFGELPLRVQRDLGPWPISKEPLLAGVNSFGFGGANAHVVLQNAPAAESEAGGASPAPQGPFLLPISAHNEQTLRAMAAAYRDLLTLNANAPENGSSHWISDVCYTASLRRSHRDRRLVVVGKDSEEIGERLGEFLKDKPVSGVVFGVASQAPSSKLAFVFPGQGPQWPGMGCELLEHEPVFRETIRECDRLFQQYANWSLLQELAAEEEQSRLSETEFAQPAIFALQVALAALWRSYGVEPDAVVGHSMGEVAAAHVAGLISLPDAVRIIFHRARLMQRATGLGRMVALNMSPERVRSIIKGYEDSVSIAGNNAPETTVISGDAAALDKILNSQGSDLFYRYLPVNYAFHSPQMETFRIEFVDALMGLMPLEPRLPMISTVTGKPLTAAGAGVDYWGRNLRDQVLFADAIQHLVSAGHGVFLELSPHPTLVGAIMQSARSSQSVHAFPSLRQKAGEVEQVLSSLGAVHTVGRSVDWKRLYPQGGRHVALPSYPWQRERCWFEADDSALWDAGPIRANESRHPLLGRRLSVANPVWEIELGRHTVPYLADHRVQGSILVPGTAFAEMAMAAAREYLGGEALPVTEAELEVKKVLALPETGSVKVQIGLAAAGRAEAIFSIQCQVDPKDKGPGGWVLHATGTVRFLKASPPAPQDSLSVEKVQSLFPDELDAAACYSEFHRVGLQYGPAFQGIERFWRGAREAIARIRIPQSVTDDLDSYHAHPALLDACGQALALMVSQGGATYLPVSVDRFRVYANVRATLWAKGTLTDSAESGQMIVVGSGVALDHSGNVLMEIEGLRLQRMDIDASAPSRNPSTWLYRPAWRAAPAVVEKPVGGRRWLILADEGGVGRACAERLADFGQEIVLVYEGERFERLPDAGTAPPRYRVAPSNPLDFTALLGDLTSGEAKNLYGIVHLWNLDMPADDSRTPPLYEPSSALGCSAGLHLVQAVVHAGVKAQPRLWLVTRGSQPAGEEQPVRPFQAPLWGLGRVIANEHPELRCANIDLDVTRDSREIQCLAAEILSESGEDQVALRQGTRYLCRLSRYTTETVGQEPVEPSGQLSIPGGRSYRLSAPAPGALTNLKFDAAPRRTPGLGQVEIEIRAAGLNFRDVMKALGIYPMAPGDVLWLGDECAGVISAAGPDVEGFRPGDAVMAVAPGCFASHVTTPALFVLPKPAGLSFEEAAATPIAFLTAYYALHYLARLTRGERILIHAAAGGVGQAAVQVAQWLGAEVFATAGSPEKREYLRSQGIQHVMDSRSLEFAGEIKHITKGKGVDVVLNSLSGDAIPKSLSALGAYGRFLEIGKRDIYQNSKIGLQPFQNNLSFFAIDMERLFRERPQFASSLFSEIHGLFRDGTFRAVPQKVFPLADAIQAFRYMAKGANTGKIVLAAPSHEAATTVDDSLVRGDGTYLITGGMGGLGLLVARWLAQQGARHLALVGRSAPSPIAEKMVGEMRLAGASVELLRGDVSRSDDLARILGEIRASKPPLRGVIHAAGVLDDGILLQNSLERFRAVLAPKVAGAWNLHCQTLDDPLQWFVNFSSVAAVLGSPGQGSYAAGNAFLDALALYRKARSLPTLSIGWGPWAEMGMAARVGPGKLTGGAAISSFSPAQGLACLETQLREHSAAQIVIANVDWERFFESYPSAAAAPFLAELHEACSGAAPAKASELRAALLAAEPALRQPLLEEHLHKELAAVLQIDQARLDLDRPLNTVGLDSLMAIELKTRLENKLGITVPVVTFVQGPSIRQLSVQLLDLIAPPLENSTTIDAVQAERLLENVDKLPSAEVDALLTELLKENESKAFHGGAA